jgi:hypothetical protein
MPAVYVEAHLESMWKPAYESGDDVIGDETDVELAAEWEDAGRQPGEWFKAVLACRWIDDLGNGKYAIHDLYDHAPAYVQRRMEREAERLKKGKTISSLRRDAANSRWNKEIDAKECKQNSLASKQYANGATPSPTPTPTPTPKEDSVAAQRADVVSGKSKIAKRGRGRQQNGF